MNGIAICSKKNTKEAVDVNVYDVIKCFDSLWLSECLNDLYDAGLDNDKCVLLQKFNQHANIAIKNYKWNHRKIHDKRHSNGGHSMGRIIVY